MTIRSRDVDLNESRQPEMLREMIPFVVLACVVVAMRFSVRKWFRIPYGADDYMIVAGLVSTLSLFLFAKVDNTLRSFSLLEYSQSVASVRWALLEFKTALTNT